MRRKQEWIARAGMLLSLPLLLPTNGAVQPAPRWAEDLGRTFPVFSNPIGHLGT